MATGSGQLWLVVRRWDGKRSWLDSMSLDSRACPSIQANGLAGTAHFWVELSDGDPLASPDDFVLEMAERWTTDGIGRGVARRPPRHQATLADGEKPPYAVPSMATISRRRPNGLKVVSTFSGCGGSSTGYRMAGYRVAAAVEFIDAAADSYEANKARATTMLREDVRQVSAADLLKAAGVKKGELDLLDGSPPCEPFSSAGRRDKTWGQEVEYSGKQQRTDDLFFEFARLVEGVAPKVFVAENVEGLARGRAVGHFNRICDALRGLGYRLEVRLLDAQWLGVPQSRRRLIFQGVREDLDREPAFPDPLPYRYTVREALPHIARIGTDPNFDRRRREGLTVDDMMVDADRPAPAVQREATSTPGTAEGASGVNGVVEEIVGLKHDPGGNQSDEFKRRERLDAPAPTITANGDSHFKVEVLHPRAGSGFTDATDSADEPSRTIQAVAGDRRHVDRPGILSGRVRRTFTIPELRRICGFPDDYVLTGSFAQQWERLGDSVPPPMMAAVATAIRDHVLDER